MKIQHRKKIAYTRDTVKRVRSMARVCQIGHPTRNRGTRMLNTAGFPIPMTIPRCVLRASQVVVVYHVVACRAFEIARSSAS